MVKIDKKDMKYLAIILGLLVLVYFFFQRSCRVYNDKLSKLEGRFELYKAQTEKERRETKETILGKEKEISGLLDKNGELQKQGKKIAEDNSKLNLELTELKAARPPLPETDWKIAYLAEKKVSEKQDEIIEKDRIEKINLSGQIEGWKNSYLKQKDISTALQEQLDKELSLGKNLESLNKALEGRVRTLQLKGNVKSIALVALAAYGGYELLRGKK